MNRNSIIILILILLAGGFFLFKGNADKMTPDDAMMQDDHESNMMVEEKDTTMMTDDMMSKAGSYEAYSSDKLALADSGDVVLFFRASWCPSCKTLDTDIKANMDSIPSSLTILDVDYDNSTELKKKYGVTYQHTMVQVDSSGEILKKWSGSPTLSDLASEII